MPECFGDFLFVYVLLLWSFFVIFFLILYKDRNVLHSNFQVQIDLKVEIKSIYLDELGIGIQKMNMKLNDEVYVLFFLGMKFMFLFLTFMHVIYLMTIYH